MHKVALIAMGCLFALTANGEEKVQWIDAMTACPGKIGTRLQRTKTQRRNLAVSFAELTASLMEESSVANMSASK